MKLLFPKGIGSSGSFQPFSWWGDAAIPGDAGVGPPLLYPFCQKSQAQTRYFSPLIPRVFTAPCP